MFNGWFSQIFVRALCGILQAFAFDPPLCEATLRNMHHAFEATTYPLVRFPDVFASSEASLAWQSPP
jgi:hypothetical protein